MSGFGLATTLFGAGRAGEREFAAAAEHGFDALALDTTGTRTAPNDAAAVNTAATAAGVRIQSVHCPLETAPDWSRVAGDLGWPLLMLALGPCGVSPGARLPDSKSLRQRIEALASGLPSKGLSVAVRAPAGPGLSAESIADLIESIEDARIGACLDAGHAHQSGGAPEAADALSGALLAALLHDNNGRDDSHRAPGEGTIDWPATLMTCWKSGFTGPWILAIDGHGDSAAALVRAVGARARLQAILEDLSQPMAFTE